MWRSLRRPEVLATTLAAAGILMVTMGARQSLGLFIAPIDGSTGLGIATISLALAIGQFTWGAVQPIAGALADRSGPRLVLIGGILVMALGSFGLAASAVAVIYIVGLLILPFAPETTGQPLPP